MINITVVLRIAIMYLIINEMIIRKSKSQQAKLGSNHINLFSDKSYNYIVAIL